MRYVADAGWHYAAQRRTFCEIVGRHGLRPPLRLWFQFARKTRQRSDWLNLMQIVQDQMVEHGWIPDDDHENLLPAALPHILDRGNPGVYIYFQEPGK
jgi:hypothetical protein